MLFLLFQDVPSETPTTTPQINSDLIQSYLQLLTQQTEVATSESGDGAKGEAEGGGLASDPALASLAATSTLMQQVCSTLLYSNITRCSLYQVSYCVIYISIKLYSVLVLELCGLFSSKSSYFNSQLRYNNNNKLKNNNCLLKYQ